MRKVRVIGGGFGGPNHMHYEDSQERYFRFNIFNIKDWVIRHYFDLKFDDHMIKWLRDNCSGSWKLEGWTISRNATLAFSREDEAMAFKLRWL